MCKIHLCKTFWEYGEPDGLKVPQSDDGSRGQTRGQPKNIIFMVAYGMSPSVLPMAEHFPKLVWGKGLLWRALIDRPEAARALVDMASLNSVTTASSAASSSWGSGTRIFNGWGNMLLEGAKLTLIAANSAAAIQQGLTRPWGFRSSGASSHLGISPPTPAGAHIRSNPASFVRQRIDKGFRGEYTISVSCT